MKRLVRLAGALVVPVLVVPVLSAAPASAADNVICVLPASTGCNQTVPTIQLALAAAGGNGLDNTILLGAATYTEVPYTLDGFTHALTLRGAGQGSTTVTLPALPLSQTYVAASHATVADLTITMVPGVTSSGDTGLNLTNGSHVDHVTVNATGTASAVAVNAGLSTMTNSVVLAPADAAAATRGFYSSGGNTLSDTSVTGSPAFELSDPGTVDVVSRAHLRSDTDGVLTDGGSIMIDDSVIDLGAGTFAVGLDARNTNNSTSLKTITADHVTIVGGGASSRGVWAYAAAPGAIQTSTVNLTNSIVRGPATSLVADASNDGLQGGPSTAALNVSHSDYETAGGTIAPGTGAGGVLQGAGILHVDPAFVSSSDLHLTLGSPVVDQGAPAPGPPATDLDRMARVQDGDGDGTAVRDMGAYELSDTTAPNTTIDSGPTGPTGDATPTFAFSSTEAGSSFVCQVDGGSETGCSSPLTTSVLTDGPHTLTVAATDPVGNTDLSPATRGFTVDTAVPDTTISSGPTGATGDATPTFSFTSSEPGASFECKVDTAAYAGCVSPFTTSALQDGSHVLAVRAKDAAANVDATPATRAWIVDATAPDTTVTKKPARRSTKKKVKLVFGSSEAGATFECALDGGAFTACTSPLKLKVKVGKHTVLVRAVDAVGNIDATPARVRFRRVAPRA